MRNPLVMQKNVKIDNKKNAIDALLPFEIIYSEEKIMKIGANAGVPRKFST
jgi:hypothetical protein